jgi:hypothetical protein
MQPSARSRAAPVKAFSTAYCPPGSSVREATKVSLNRWRSTPFSAIDASAPAIKAMSFI